MSSGRQQIVVRPDAAVKKLQQKTITITIKSVYNIYFSTDIFATFGHVGLKNLDFKS
jgi:hypothetical protein